MKILQTRFLKIIGPLALFFAASIPLLAQPQNATLAQADSLFRAHQYTQSFALYDQLHKQKKYSPAMLLKMAYIQEGLGRQSLSLYYLNLYYLATDDSQALQKMEEVATRNRLQGYENNATLELFARVREYNLQIMGTLAALIVLMFAVLIYRRVRHQARPVLAGFLVLFFCAILYGYAYYSKAPDRGIVIDSPAYLMSGPSAGSATVAILSEGHQLEILGKQDVWINVRWMDRKVYIKENELLTIKL